MLRRMADFFRFLMTHAIPVPAFRFDKGLYDRLCREKQPNGESIVAPDQEPKVVFEMGPVDGELGRCDPRTGRITIDVLEHFLISAQGRPMTLAQIKQKFDDRMTETLAHEGGHWQLDKRAGFWAMMEKFAWQILLLIVGLAIGVFIVMSYSNFIVGRLIPLMWSLSPVLGVVGVILTSVIYLWVIIRFVPLYFGFCMAVSAALTYKICWHERYARKFAKRTETDPRWEDVVQVD